MTGDIPLANGIGYDTAHGFPMFKQELHFFLLGVLFHFIAGYPHRQINPGNPKLSGHVRPFHGNTKSDRFLPERETEFFKGYGNTGIQQGFRTLFLYPSYNGIIHTLTLYRVIDFVWRATVCRFVNFQLAFQFGYLRQGQLTA